MSLRRGCSLPVPCHDGSTVLAVVFESLVVLSAVSGSGGGGWGWGGVVWSGGSCIYGCATVAGACRNDVGTLGAGTNPSACG